jgi:metal-responsive CopG/Arc/MetJ family transcriptional regulator
MARSVKIAVTLPSNMARDVEKLRKKTGETRSATVQRALRLLLESADLQQRVRQYVDGYRQLPESDREVAAAEARAREQLARIPWE